jgi:hypothetical protein
MTRDIAKRMSSLPEKIERERRLREQLDPELPVMQIPIDQETVLNYLPGD